MSPAARPIRSPTRWTQRTSFLHDPAGAVTRYRDLQTRRPNAPEISIDLGNALAALGEDDKALVEYGRGIDGAKGTTRAIGFYDRATSLFRLGRILDARASYVEALRLDSNDRDAKFKSRSSTGSSAFSGKQSPTPRLSLASSAHRSQAARSNLGVLRSCDAERFRRTRAVGVTGRGGLDRCGAARDGPERADELSGAISQWTRRSGFWMRSAASSGGCRRCSRVPACVEAVTSTCRIEPMGVSGVEPAGGVADGCFGGTRCASI